MIMGAGNIGLIFVPPDPADHFQYFLLQILGEFDLKGAVAVAQQSIRGVLSIGTFNKHTVSCQLEDVAVVRAARRVGRFYFRRDDSAV